MIATQLPPSLIPEGRTLFIGGRWSAGDDFYDRPDPSCAGQRTGTYARASAEHVETAYSAAATAQPQWAAVPAPQRSEILRRAADLLEGRLEEATRRLTADMGKARRDARGEVVRSVSILRYFAGELLQPTGDTYASADPSVLLLTLEEPVGVVCAITPWNFPFAIPTWKLAPALAFGNAVVWKPADAASGSAVLLTETLAAAGLPDGVLNLVTGKGRLMSASLTKDPRLNALTFTGSGDVGSLLRQSVADRNIKVQLELGGKNPAVVLADADLRDAAAQIVRGAMGCTGQRCTATSRVYVERSVAPEFRNLIRQQVESLTVGDPYDEGTDVGPVVSAEQQASIQRYMAVAAEENAELIAKGASGPTSGYFVAPTVFGGLGRDSIVAREEIFGPVLVLEEVDGFEEALRAANDTEFGLSSAIFTRDITHALSFARLARSGLVHVNRETAGVEPHVPFGGLKGSSNMAREQGKAARTFFTNTKTVYVRTP